MPRLIWVFAGRTATLLVLSRGGSFFFVGVHICTMGIGPNADTDEVEDIASDNWKHCHCKFDSYAMYNKAMAFAAKKKSWNDCHALIGAPKIEILHLSLFCLTRSEMTYTWASSWENLSSGVSDQSDSNWHAQLQKLSWGLKFWLQKLEPLHYLGSEQQRRWSGWSAPLLFAYDIIHIFSWPGSHGLTKY